MSDNNKSGWNEYEDIKKTLTSLLKKGYTKEMIKTVLEQIDLKELNNEDHCIK